MLSPAKKLDIFKPGRFTAMSGTTLNFSAADLETTARVYSPDVYEAPLVVGHPETNHPAYGWVKTLSYAGTLEAEPHQVDPEFARMVNDGRFKHVSASFFPPNHPSNPVPGTYYLCHVGFLGAAPPAVMGLRTASFGAAGELLSFQMPMSGVGGFAVAGLLRRLRDWMIGEKGLEVADTVLPDYQIRDVEQAAMCPVPDAEAPVIPAFTAPAATQEEPTPMPTEAELQAQADDLKARETALAKREADHRSKEHVAFAASLVTDGKLQSGRQAQVVAIMAQLSDATTIEFAAGDGKTAKAPLLESFKELMSGQPKLVDLTEFAAPDELDAASDRVEFAAAPGTQVDQARAHLHAKAKAYQRQHNTDFWTAYAAVGGK